LRYKVFDSYIDLGRGIKGYRGEIEAFSFYYYNITVYRQLALSRHINSILVLYRQGDSNLNKLYLVVRALIVKISIILVGEGRGDLSVVNCRVSITMISLGRFPLECD
jgi:hypothetical protein